MQFMMDLETRGTTPGCGIVSIGIIAFDPFAPLPDGVFADYGFYTVVTEESCIDNYLHSDADTDAWWAKQSTDARKALVAHKDNDGLGIRQALIETVGYVASHGAPSKALVWGNGADFDNPIINVAARMVDVKLPWQWGNRCYRTIKGLDQVFGSEFAVPKKVGTVAHNALADAKDQALHHWEIVQHVRSLIKEK